MSIQPDSTDYSLAIALSMLFEGFDDWWRDYLPILLADPHDAESVKNAPEKGEEEKLVTEIIN